LEWIDVSEARTASIIIAIMLEAIRTSETLVHSNQSTRRYIPGDSKLHNGTFRRISPVNMFHRMDHYRSIKEILNFHPITGLSAVLMTQPRRSVIGLMMEAVRTSEKSVHYL
jgi:hypothetical protein